MLQHVKKLWSIWIKENTNNKNERYSQYALLLFFILALASFDNYSDYKSLAGDLPPNTEILIIRGNFVSHQSKGITHIGISGEILFPKRYTSIVKSGNSTYSIHASDELEISSTAQPLIYDFIHTRHDTDILFYGFKLENGEGFIYPIKITDLQGKTYISSYPADFIYQLLYQREAILQTLYYQLFFLFMTFVLMVFLGNKAIQVHQIQEVNSSLK